MRTTVPHALAAGAPSSARDGVDAVTQRWAVLLRLSTGVGGAVVGLLTPGPAGGVPVLLLLLGWSTFRLLDRARHTDRRLVRLDMGVVLLVGVCSPLLVTSPTDLGTLGALPAAVVCAASVTFVWQLRGRRVVAWCAAAVASVAVGGVLAGEAPSDVLAVWFLPVQTLLVWPQMGVLRRAADRADREAAALAESRAESELAGRRRLAEREHWAVLHDTASATLLVVGNGVPAGAVDRVRAQAGRDLDALASTGPRRGGPGADEVALRPLLEQLADEVDLTVSLVGTDDVRVPPDVAAALRDATRELLTNVARHAGTDRARVRLEHAPGAGGGARVEVHDDGGGFDAAVREGRGLRESVRGRVTRAGGAVELRSSPGGGSTVLLRWDPAAARAAAPPAAPRGTMAAELTRVYRLVLAFVVTISATFRLLSAHTATPYAAVEVVYVLVAGAVLGLVATAAARRRPLPAAATALVVVAFVLDVVLALRLGPTGVGGVQDWSSQSVGWLWFFCLGTQRRGRLLALLCAPYVVRLGIVLAAGEVDPLRVIGSLGLGLVVLQIGQTLFLAELEARAARAERERDERLEVEAARTVADGLLVDFRERSAAIRATTVPLLRELADGTADPTDETTRHRARIEGARLRRMFAEADAQDASLSAEVRSVVEEVERGGVSTTLALEATPPLPTAVRRALLDEPMAALALARSRARVVVQQVEGEVVVSVTTDGPPPPGPPPDTGDPATTTIRASVGDRTWVQASRPVTAAPPAPPRPVDPVPDRPAAARAPA